MNKGQVNSVNSLHSFIPSLYLTRSRIILRPDLKREIASGLENDACYSDIL